MPISNKINENLANASWIRLMFEEGERLQKILGPEKVYDFTLGNPDTEPPPAFREMLKKLADNPLPGMHGYMSNSGYETTREAIAANLAEKTGIQVNSSHIVMTCGAGGGLNVVFKTILNPGDEVIVLVPYFAEYKFYVDNHSGVIKEVPTGADFQPDMDAIGAAITSKTKAIIVNSPNNPTGVVYSSDCLEKLAAVIKQKESEFGAAIYLVSDEPYARIVYDGVKTPPVFNYAKNSILVTSHSKDLSLAGERIGYIAVHPEAADAGLLIEGMVFCNRTLGFVNAPALMQRLVAHLQKEQVDLSGYLKKRDLLYSHLTEIGFKIVKPKGAFYMFPQSPLADDLEFVQLAKKYNILLVPGKGFGLKGYFRLSYSVPLQTVINSLPAFTDLAKEAGL